LTNKKLLFLFLSRSIHIPVFVPRIFEINGCLTKTDDLISLIISRGKYLQI